MGDEKTEGEDGELIIFDSTPIWKDGRVVEDEGEIIEYIDTRMKPQALQDPRDPGEAWPLLRAHLMHMYLSTKEEKAEASRQAAKEGVDLGRWILDRMKEKYPDYW